MITTTTYTTTKETNLDFGSRIAVTMTLTMEGIISHTYTYIKESIISQIIQQSLNKITTKSKVRRKQNKSNI